MRAIDSGGQLCLLEGADGRRTEYGEYVTAPGDVIFIPEGIAHRATGTADSLRWFAFVSTPFVHFMSEANETSQTEFTVTRRGGGLSRSWGARLACLTRRGSPSPAADSGVRAAGLHADVFASEGGLEVGNHAFDGHSFVFAW